MTKEEIQNILASVADFLALSENKKVFDTFHIIEKKLEDPNIWSDRAKAVEIQKQHASLQKKVSQLHNLSSLSEQLEIAIELQDESAEVLFTSLCNTYEELQNFTYLQGPFDTSGVLLSVHSGAGGLDAQDFASMLVSMYQTFCKKNDLTATLVALSLGEEGGTKSATLEITGQFAYGLLKEEAGVHRLVRISPFNSGKTRETSFALVEALPNDIASKIEIPDINEKDLKWEYSMSSGKGGQSVNTTYSAVRVVHIPTGIAATCQNERSQLQNKQMALTYLTNKIAAHEAKKHAELQQEIKGNFVSAEWGSQIRSYVLHPYKLVKDHRSGFETSNVVEVFEQGDILPFIWAMKKHS